MYTVHCGHIHPAPYLSSPFPHQSPIWVHWTAFSLFPVSSTNYSLLLSFISNSTKVLSLLCFLCSFLFLSLPQWGSSLHHSPHMPSDAHTVVPGVCSQSTCYWPVGSVYPIWLHPLLWCASCSWNPRLSFVFLPDWSCFQCLILLLSHLTDGCPILQIWLLDIIYVAFYVCYVQHALQAFCAAFMLYMLPYKEHFSQIQRLESPDPACNESSLAASSHGRG